jgi:hypothetical protein
MFFSWQDFKCTKLLYALTLIKKNTHYSFINMCFLIFSLVVYLFQLIFVKSCNFLVIHGILVNGV